MINDFDFSAYEKTVQGTEPAIIEFYKPSCPHCKRTEAGLQELAESYSGKIAFGKVNIEEQTVLAQRLDVRTLPTLLFIRDGKEINRKTGFTHKLIVEEEIKKLV